LRWRLQYGRFGAAQAHNRMPAARGLAFDQGLENHMQHVRPIAERVLRYVLNKLLKEAAKVHYL
jgi:hypothetical protein